MAVYKPFTTKNGIDINSFRLTNLADPVDVADAVNKNYSTNASNIKSGKLSVQYGGTNGTTTVEARTNLLPTQIAEISGYVLSTTGSDVQWTMPFSGSYNDLTNKPTYASVAYSGLLGDLVNVDLATTPPQNGEVLTYDSVLEKWKPMVPPGALTQLSTLSDVNTTGAQEGSTLVYDPNTQKWVATNVLTNITIDAGSYGTGV